MPRPQVPKLTIDDAGRVARELFGLEGSVVALPSYIDQNFKIGDGWVLKVANATDAPSTVDLQLAVMQTIAEAEPGLAPALRRSVEGRSVERIEHDGQHHLVHAIEFLNGTLLADARHVNASTWRHLGESLARIDRALANLDHPAMRRETRWDLANAQWIVPEVAALFDPERRRLIERVATQYLADVQRVLDRLPHSVIHNDANEHNVMVDDREEGARISGLFDLGDTVWTARVFELAIGGAYAMLGQADPLEVLAHLAAGYHESLPLSELEISALFPAACMRLAVSVTASSLHNQHNPGNDYSQVSKAPAWNALATLIEIDPHYAATVLRAACGFPEESQSESPSGISRLALPTDEVRALRAQHVNPSLSLSYQQPLEIVRGRGQFLFDRNGRAYLDGVNNVCHVGHCHPRVVDAARQQIGRLNTNTRYLHQNIGRFAERLSGLFPEHLEVCYFVNSGSEANELALRLAQTATGRRDMIAIEHGYHGHTSALIELSSYKHAGPGGRGTTEWVHIVPCPDPYRGRFRGADSGSKYVETVAETLELARSAGRSVAGIIAEPIIGCGGQILPPEGYLARAFELVRAAGGLCIADEVQVGFGRVGSHWWAFEAQGAVPDIVTMGKPIGNGHPMAAVITTREIAEAFDNGMEFFATFGGNPVSCAVGLAVLDVIEEEGLRANAAQVGSFLIDELTALAGSHPSIGDVRGLGYYLGVEIVRDRDSNNLGASGAPDAATLTRAIEAMRQTGVLMSTDGPDHNVLKFKPPMVFGRRDAELFLSAFDRALSELGR